MDAAATSAPAPPPAPAPAPPPATAADAAALLEAERDRHRARAARFGTAFVDPASVNPAARALDRRARLTKPGFATGIDVLDPAEQAKAAARAARFGVDPAAALSARRAAPPLPDPAEEAAKRARAARFGGTYVPPDVTGQMEVDLVAPRTEVDPSIPRRPDAVHLYGVDTLSTRDALAYFSEYGPTFVEWINDSSCNVLFADAGSAARALVGSGVPLPPEEGDPLCGVDAGGQAAVARFLWHRGPDFKKPGQAEGLPLLFRMAAVTDVRPPRGGGGGGASGDQPASRRLWQSSGGRRGGGGGRREGRRPAAGGVRKPRQRDRPASRTLAGAAGDVAMREAEVVVQGVDVI